MVVGSALRVYDDVNGRNTNEYEPFGASSRLFHFTYSDSWAAYVNGGSGPGGGGDWRVSAPSHSFIITCSDFTSTSFLGGA